jgi:transposase InsO family protein
VVQTPFQAPNAYAYAERFARSIQDECVGRVILFGERHLRRILAQSTEHYHHERNHQGLGNELIDPVCPRRGTGGIRCRERLGGLLNYYYRAA